MRAPRIRLDKKRVVRFTMRSYLAIADTLRMTREEVGRALSCPAAKFDNTIVGTVLWAGLTPDDPDLSLGYVKGLVGEMTPWQKTRAFRAIARALKILNAEVEARRREFVKIKNTLDSMNRRVGELTADFPKPQPKAPIPSVPSGRKKRGRR